MPQVTTNLNYFNYNMRIMLLKKIKLAYKRKIMSRKKSIFILSISHTLEVMMTISLGDEGDNDVIKTHRDVIEQPLLRCQTLPVTEIMPAFLFTVIMKLRINNNNNM